MKIAMIVLTALLTVFSAQPTHAISGSEAQTVSEPEQTLVASRSRGKRSSGRASRSRGSRTSGRASSRRRSNNGARRRSRGPSRRRLQRTGRFQHRSFSHRRRFKRNSFKQGQFKRHGFRKGQFRHRGFKRHGFKQGRFKHHGFKHRPLHRRHGHHFPSALIWIDFPLHHYGWYSAYASGSVSADFTADQFLDSSEWISVDGASKRFTLAQQVALALDSYLASREINTLEVAQVENKIYLRGTVPSQDILNQVILIVSDVPGVIEVDASQVDISAG